MIRLGLWEKTVGDGDGDATLKWELGATYSDRVIGTIESPVSQGGFLILPDTIHTYKSCSRKWEGEI